MSEKEYRVRMVIYDDVESTADEPYVFTDEPMYSTIGDAYMQLERTFKAFDRKQEKGI